MCRTAALALVVITSAIAGCATLPDQSEALATIPYHRQASGRVIVPATVNDAGPFRFAIDTGASISAIMTSLHDAIEPRLPIVRQVRVQGLVGRGTYPAVEIGEIGVGATRWRDVHAVVLPTDGDADLDGLLGLDFLRDYVIVFPAREQVVNLFRPRQFDARDYLGWLSIPLEERRVSHTGARLYFLELRIGEARIPAILDLGVGFNIMNFPAAALLGMTPEALRERLPESIAGAFEKAPEAYRIKIRNIGAGGVRWQAEHFVIGDLPVFEAVVDAGQPAAILGAGLFLRSDFVIDFPHSRLMINRMRRQ